MGLRAPGVFALLIAAQAAHSVEEYVFRLYDVLAPARFVSGLLSTDPSVGFALANAAVVLFGVWCCRARVWPGHRSWRGWAWFWVVLETGNGIGHGLLALSRGGYFPGVGTAPLLLALALSLGVVLLRDANGARPSP